MDLYQYTKTGRKYIWLVLLLLTFVGCNSNNDPAPLNVIIVLVDDMGYGDVGALGNPVIKTPNFDKLCRESARFTNFSVSPTCSPTRAALMTGRHEFLVGVTHTINRMNLIDTTAVTIAQLFQNKGYKTGMFGKWHLGQTENYGPWFRGFDETLTVPGDRQNSHFDPILLQNREKKQFKGYREDILFSEAIKFINRNKGRPFFCYLPTYSPHGPNIAPEKYVEPYSKLKETGKYPDINPDFFGQVANVDANLGKLMSFLDSAGLANNTLLIAMNDNGGLGGVPVYNAGMRGRKMTVWQGGIRAYSFWKWDGHILPGDRNQMSGHVDVFPTLADLCQLEIPLKVQNVLSGSSLRPALENASAELGNNRMQIHHTGRWDVPEHWADFKYASSAVSWGNYILERIEPPYKHLEHSVNYRKIQSRSVSNPDFKLTKPGEWELYNIISDPHQDKNIAEENPEIVKKMSDFYEEWWQKVEVKMTMKWGENE